MNKDEIKISIDDNVAKILRENSMQNPDEIGTQSDGISLDPSTDDINYDITPDELISYLKQFVVGQSQAIEMVATKICTHLHRMRYEQTNPDLPDIVGHVKPNMMLIGPTGVGKTYIIKLLAQKVGIPFVKGDATKFSETGYVGGDVEDLVRELVHISDGDIRLAEHGIIYIDEIDKIASSGSLYGPDVSRGGVQRNLLKLMEETEVDMKVPHDLASQMEAVVETQRTGKAKRKKVNTRNILFILSGAFVHLPQIIARRLKKGGTGFSDEPMRSMDDVESMLGQLHAKDLIEFGFESEFVGRVPVVSHLHDINEDGLYKILKNPKSSVVESKKRDFISYGIKLSFADSALKFLAKDSVKLNTGARGLVSVTENALLPFERALPSTSIDNLHITKEMCADPQKYLSELINKNAFESFVNKFYDKTRIKVEFSPAAYREAEEVAASKGILLSKLLNDSLKNYEHGLKLTGKEKFTITASVIKDPQGYLNNLIKKNYQSNAKNG